jgi:hypothetical protein
MDILDILTGIFEAFFVIGASGVLQAILDLLFPVINNILVMVP